MSKYKDTDYAICPKTGRGINMEVERKEYSGVMCVTVLGTVNTPNGIVRVSSYKECDKRNLQQSYMEIIKEGREHTRYFEKAYSSRGLVTKAKQFAKDVYGDSDE